MANRIDFEMILADLRRQRETLERLADQAVGRRVDREQVLNEIERLRKAALRAQFGNDGSDGPLDAPDSRSRD